MKTFWVRLRKLYICSLRLKLKDNKLLSLSETLTYGTDKIFIISSDIRQSGSYNDFDKVRNFERKLYSLSI
jgi:hypothetical protein